MHQLKYKEQRNRMKRQKKRDYSVCKNNKAKINTLVLDKRGSRKIRITTDGKRTFYYDKRVSTESNIAITNAYMPHKRIFKTIKQKPAQLNENEK